MKCIYIRRRAEANIELTICESARPYCIKIVAEMKRQMNELQELPIYKWDNQSDILKESQERPSNRHIFISGVHRTQNLTLLLRGWVLRRNILRG
jgi:hypothetical protein